MSQTVREDDESYEWFKAVPDEDKKPLPFIRNLMRDRREDLAKIERLENSVAYFEKQIKELKNPTPEKERELTEYELKGLSTDGRIKD